MHSPSAPALAASPGTCTLADGTTAARGFDQYGYNRCAGIFNGIADGLNRVNGDNELGVYSQDHLVMKWNEAWSACNANRTAANCAGAWLTNEWNGQIAGGSGESWHYKNVWVGNCIDNPALVPVGGYCIWGEYAVVLSHGTVANEHFWDAHARPNGFGSL